MALSACTCERATPAARGGWLSYIFDKRNSCLLKNAGEMAWTEVSVGTRLFGGDALKTGPDSSARLRFRDGTSFDLLAESLIVLKETGAVEGRPDADRRIEIALMEGDLAAMIVDPAAARVDVKYGADGTVGARRGSSSSLVFRVSAKGDRGVQVTAGEAVVSDSAGHERVIAARSLVAPGAAPEGQPASAAAREREARPPPARVHASLQQTEVPTIPPKEMDALVTRAADLEALAKKSVSQIRAAEAAAARRNMAAIVPKLAELRAAMGEVERLSTTVLREAEGMRDAKKRASVLVEINTIELLQRDLARELAVIERELATSPEPAAPR